MKPNTYYRRPDLLVGLTDKKGRFSHAVRNQIQGETSFHEQRLSHAAIEFRKGHASAKRLVSLADYWRVIPQRLLKAIQKGG